MSSARTTRHRLTAAVTAALAVTLGAGALTVPAVAAPAPGPAAVAKTADAPISLPAARRIVSSGPSGFLTTAPASNDPFADSIYRWTSTVDGTTKVLPASGTYYGGFSDIVVAKVPTQSSYRLYDMSSPDLSYETYELSGSPTLMGAVGSTLLMSTYSTATHTGELRLKTRGISSGSDRLVTGLPADARIRRAEPASVSTALVTYSTLDANSVLHHHLALVDTVTASVVEKREVPGLAGFGDSAVSGSRLAWVTAVDTVATLVYAERGGEGAGPTGTPIPLGNSTNAQVAFLGDWLTYSAPGAPTATAPNPHHALTAYNVTTGAKVKLLDHATSSVNEADGSLLVRGGSLAQGEGVYRISIGEDGAPIVALVASTGEPTALTMVSSKVPAVVDLDKNGGRATLEWTLSRALASGTVKLRHVRTGGTAADHSFDSSLNWTSGTGVVALNWQGLLGGEHAPNGDYTWELNATPKNGIGPAVKQTGTFKVVRKPNGHDYNDNGSPDLLALTSTGTLWRDDLVRSESTGAGIYVYQRKQAGSGWQIYNQIEAAGNHTGNAAGDVVARDTAGVLWSYLGRGDGTFAPRTRIGAGWNTYNKIAAGSDLTGDGRPDLVATDTTGVLWLYKATGNWQTPYAARTRIGGGWGVYNQITAVGDIAGGGAGDLVARDTAGVLWLYLGNGDGTFAARTRIGGGWGAYTHLVGAGDIDKDGRADIVAYGPGGTYVYGGTGVPAAPLGARQATWVYTGEGSSFKNVI
ncbi:VCBS repeat-containing protein [Streptomyces sp. NBC_00090]|uniref:FG-GAP repeat domain-containing protein n=1 Tax=Streptomyces sp. NBC_00090 TaxID=2903619 RepID=UPI0032462107